MRKIFLEFIFCEFILLLEWLHRKYFDLNFTFFGK